MGLTALHNLPDNDYVLDDTQVNTSAVVLGHSTPDSHKVEKIPLRGVGREGLVVNDMWMREVKLVESGNE